MNSETRNATRYRRTRKENRGKQNRDNTIDKELTLMSMDHTNLIASKTTHHRLPHGRPTQKACLNCKPFRMGAIPNGDVFLSTTRRYTAIASASPFRMGFTNAGYNHGSRYERVPPSRPGLLEEVTTIRCYYFFASHPTLSTPTATGFTQCHHCK